MATARYVRTWRRGLCALGAGMVLVACDLGPLTGADETGGRTPVETVTALEIEVRDIPTDPAVPARHEASGP